jgi:hypothetical protein
MSHILCLATELLRSRVDRMGRNLCSKSQRVRQSDQKDVPGSMPGRYCTSGPLSEKETP